MMEGIGFQRGLVGGLGTLESSIDKLAENNEPKRLAFSAVVIAIELPTSIRSGKLNLK